LQDGEREQTLVNNRPHLPIPAMTFSVFLLCIAHLRVTKLFALSQGIIDNAGDFEDFSR